MRLGSRAAGTVVAGVLIAVALPSAPAHAASCAGRVATITGTPGRDRIRGTPRADVIAALGGSDLVRGRGGDDRICGGGGADILEGKGGADVIRGGGAGDVIEGDAGKDRIHAGGGSDFLDGGAGSDVIRGGGGAIDLLRGRGGRDRLFGGGGFDILIGDGGNDRFHGGGGRVDLATFVRAPGGVTVDLIRGRATGEGSDRLRGVEDIEGTRFDDVLIGNARQNFLVALGGDDVIQGNGGIDQLLFLASQSPVTLDLSAGTAAGEGTDAVSGVAGAYGSPYNDTLIGDDQSNFLFGWEGNDIISGLGGDDILDGDSGLDEGDGGEGIDICAHFENGNPPPNCESSKLPSGIRTEGIRSPSTDRLTAIHRVLD